MVPEVVSAVFTMSERSRDLVVGTGPFDLQETPVNLNCSTTRDPGYPVLPDVHTRDESEHLWCEAAQGTHTVGPSEVSSAGRTCLPLQQAGKRLSRWVDWFWFPSGSGCHICISPVASGRPPSVCSSHTWMIMLKASLLPRTNYVLGGGRPNAAGISRDGRQC